jgi:superfamily II DNA/RNA helicase
VFPEKRVIEYESGKLRAMAVLLHRLKAGDHKVVLFTQMSKMLDVIEKFLSLNGYTYVRLDGSTKIEHRQLVVDRFNGSRRIFCFISSTRSGGVGINLTSADSVIFYDSDWNPAMDRQAMDRCHRIGQTREVHIYRLVSEGTVEEHILVKQLERRQLDEIVMDFGRFDLAGFDRDQYIASLGTDSHEEGMVVDGKKKDTAAVIATSSVTRDLLSSILDKGHDSSLDKAIDELGKRGDSKLRAAVEDQEDFIAGVAAAKEDENTHPVDSENSNGQGSVSGSNQSFDGLDSLPEIARFAVEYLIQSSAPIQ